MRFAGPVTAVTIVAEIVALYAVAHATSWGTALLLLVAVSVVGGALVRRESAAALFGLRGHADARNLADGAVRVGASLLVAVPGFVTAALGLLLLVPPVRILAARTLGPRWAGRLQPYVLRRGGWPGAGRGTRGAAGAGGPVGPEVIDGELAEPAHPAQPVQPAGAPEAPRRPDLTKHRQV